MAADRGAFIDQSQSFNVFIGEPNFGKLTSMHFYGWKKVNIYIFLYTVKNDFSYRAQSLQEVPVII